MKAKTFSKRLTHLALVLCFSATAFNASNASAQGIPVIDATNLEQSIQQVLSWGQQLKGMADQFQQAQQQLESLTGTRMLGNILNDPNLQQYFKDERMDVDALRQQYGSIDPCKSLTNSEAIQYCQDVNEQPYQNYDQISQAMEIADQKTQQIQDLILEINETDDPKSIAELQARIQGEQSAIQNELIRMQLTLQQQQIQTQLVKDQQSMAASERTRTEKENARKISGSERLENLGI